MTKEGISFIVSKEILIRDGKFTVNDIFDSVKDKITESISNENLKKYIKKKMDDMCEDGLIAKTETYYFQYN